MNDPAPTVERFMQFMRSADTRLAAELFSSDFIAHTAMGDFQGPDGYTGFIAAFHQGFPDLEITLADSLATDTQQMVRWTAVGTHTGDLAGVGPTGQRVEIKETHVHRLRDGQITDDEVAPRQLQPRPPALRHRGGIATVSIAPQPLLAWREREGHGHARSPPAARALARAGPFPQRADASRLGSWPPSKTLPPLRCPDRLSLPCVLDYISHRLRDGRHCSAVRGSVSPPPEEEAAAELPGPVPSPLQLARARGPLRGRLALLGPAFVAAVAYIDPGNFATNIAGGAKYGLLLVWVIVGANLMAMLVQYRRPRRASPPAATSLSSVARAFPGP